MQFEKLTGILVTHTGEIHYDSVLGVSMTISGVFVVTGLWVEDDDD